MSFNEEALERHNYYRKIHGVQALTLSSSLSAFAQEWANILAQKEMFQHRDQILYGENLFYASSTDPKFDVDAARVVKSWYDEISKYKFGKEPKNLAQIGHFTQVIWAKTIQMGIAKARGNKNKYYVVANYSPPGNYIGKFAENVPKKR